MENLEKNKFSPCEVSLYSFGKDVITTSGGEDPFKVKDEDFDVFGFQNNVGGNE